jgi:two-component system response regulator AtoC
MIERAMILTDGGTIEKSALPPAVLAGQSAGAPQPGRVEEDEDLSLKRARQLFEAQLIRRALGRTGGNRTHAAKLLEISHRALLYKLKDYGIRD